jgi:hypothetical protein
MASGVSFFLHDGVVLESSGSEEEAAVAPIYRGCQAPKCHVPAWETERRCSISAMKGRAIIVV